MPSKPTKENAHITYAREALDMMTDILHMLGMYSSAVFDLCQKFQVNMFVCALTGFLEDCHVL